MNHKEMNAELAHERDRADRGWARVAELEELARQMLMRYEDAGFPRVSQAKFDEWQAIAAGEDG